MKETTRQLILLFGVLTLLTASVIVINTADTGGGNGTPADINETGANQSYNVTEPDTLIGKSIGGYQIMMDDIQKAMGMASDTSERP